MSPPALKRTAHLGSKRSQIALTLFIHTAKQMIGREAALLLGRLWLKSNGRILKFLIDCPMSIEVNVFTDDAPARQMEYTCDRNTGDT